MINALIAARSTATQKGRRQERQPVCGGQGSGGLRRWRNAVRQRDYVFGAGEPSAVALSAGESMALLGPVTVRNTQQYARTKSRKSLRISVFFNRACVQWVDVCATSGAWPRGLWRHP